MIDPFGVHDLVKAARQLDPNDNVFEKHKNKQYEWVLCLPASDLAHCSDDLPISSTRGIPGDDQNRYFGCNLLDWSKPVETGHRLPGDPDDKYVLLATPIDIDLHEDQSTPTDVEFTTHQFQVIQEHAQNIEMAASSVTQSPMGATDHASRPSPLSAVSTPWSTTARVSDDYNDTLTVDSHQELNSPPSLTEDSFEKLDHGEDEKLELDRFKDNIDAITAAASQMSLSNSQGESPRGPADKQTRSPSAATKRQSAGRPAQTGDMPIWAQPADASHDIAGSTSTSSPVDFSPESTPQTASPQRNLSTQNTSREPPTATLRRVARPASLAPPKPIQKAKKRPTMSNFELPGEKVARELKDRKAARLSMQVDPQKAAEVNSLQRTRSVRSSKPPTVPNFELPGERLSRQKKERFEQKLKEAEDQAHQRRQFKARPSPANAAPTVRSTFTSRQRQTPGQPDQASVLSPNSDFSPRTGFSKRQSVTMTPSTARTVSISSAATGSSAGRGRRSSAGSAKASTRATSSSAGSARSGGKRNSVATEKSQQRKVQERQIYNRDNNAGRTKEQEKRDREESMRLARQKYAQMSRNLAATSRAKRNQQQASSSAQEEVTSPGPKDGAPQVPKHRDLYIGRNF